MTAGRPDTVDQLVFRWDADNPTGSTGFGLVAWSGDRDRAERVQHAVGPRLQVAGEPAAPGLVRVLGRSGNSVLLGHRTPGLDPAGRPGTVCHALEGPAEHLTTAACLALHAWTWQRDPLPLDRVRGPLAAVPVTDLTAGREENLLRLTRASREPRVTGTLAAVVAEVLRNPNRRFALLDRSEGRDPFAVLWGLHGIFGELLAGQPLGWSFATHDTDDATRLRFVFLPDWPAHASADGSRVRLDPERRRGDLADELADRLTRWHLTPAEPGFDGKGTTVAAALRAASPPPGRRADDGWLLRSAERALGRDSRPGPRPGPGPREVPRRPADDELLRALGRRDTPAEDLPTLLAEADARLDGWPASRQERFCVLVLERRLFLAHLAAGEPDDRAAQVTRLYRRAVRRFASEPWAADRLRTLLPQLWLASDTSPAAREVLREILGDRPGLPEDVWVVLFRAATRPPSPTP
ncbi:hypothetical protein E1265_25090, partial [Streptomyces sp. 8K308]